MIHEDCVVYVSFLCVELGTYKVIMVLQIIAYAFVKQQKYASIQTSWGQLYESSAPFT